MATQNEQKRREPEPKARKAKEAKEVKETKEPKEEKPGKAEAPAREAKEGKTSWHMIVAAIIVIAVIAVLAFFFIIPAVTGVPFQSFKSNFKSAPRVALAVTYLNQSQLSAEIPCYTTLLEVIGTTRNASDIDFLLINQTKCQYSPSGLGEYASFETVSASACDEIANNEPSIFMSYGAHNSTRVTSDHLYLEADPAYLQACPIAAEFG